MSTNSDYQQIVRRRLEVWNTHDVSQLDQLVDESTAPDFILHDPSLSSPIRSLTEFRQWAHNVLQDAPDIHITVEDLFGEGDKVASRFTVRGTSTSAGKMLEFPAIVLWRFADGKVVETWQHPGNTPAARS